MKEVQISPIPLGAMARVLGPDRMAALLQAASGTVAHLSGKRVWNVNATAQGGGVAEMLQTLLAYCQGAGVDARWLVLDGESQFFTTTKRLHNALHGSAGDGGDFGPAERANYDEVLAANFASMAESVEPGDIVLLHDPQTAGMIKPLRDIGCRVVWRSHIGRDEPNEHTARGWAFLEPYLDHAEAVIVSRATYRPPSVPEDKITIIPPSIDPFATKNLDIEPDEVLAVLARAGLITGDADNGRTIEFHRRDGSRGTMRRHDSMFAAGGPVPHDARMLLQVSRWDRLKDMPGVMTGFVEHLDNHEDAHLVLAGPAVEGVSDDPEGAEVLAECQALWQDLPDAKRRRVHLVCVPMDDVDENAHIINAMQRFAYAVTQKSLFEGFGLTVTEAMWKARPVIASAVGGIQDQIVDGRDGLLLADPTDLGSLGQAYDKVLADRDLAGALGDAAHRRVHTDFLGDRHLLQYANLFRALSD